MGIGDWGLGIGDWPNPQFPSPKIHFAIAQIPFKRIIHKYIQKLYKIFIIYYIY